ncbi:sulfatase family protein [Actinacidiphila rubida]|uniref:Arylsulfatase A n=1 Tax=Actinacidiphila rubida TaxID=310780 RepID=A0A1H8JEA9_9ACTN|nr:sulfatase [Actinacidiphila rubida]SEN79193.1 Arylsulfatase A [Actinacidiphila rubida]
MSRNDRQELGRRGFLAGAAAVTTAAVTGLATGPADAAPAAAAAGTRPNILVVLTDDQPNATEWATPNTVAWLVDGGVKFSRGHVSTPLCAPSRSSIFSGRYAHDHGVRDNSSPYNLDQHTTVQRYLHDAGYRTGLFGKYLNAWHNTDNPPHFDDWLLLDPVTYNNGTYNDNGTVHTITGYSTTVIKDRVLSFLDGAKSDQRPWFAFVAPKAPHAPNTPDAKYADTPVPAWNGRPSVPEADRSDKPAYIQNATHTLDDGRTIRRNQLRTLLSVDDAVQEIHDKLAALGQLDNTLVFYLGDNGYCWGDHGWTAKSVPYRPSIEVPFYVSWPAAGLDGGTVDDRIAANIDIAPTILDAVGITPDTPHNGLSLLGSRRRDHLLVEWWHRNPGDDPHTWASTVSATYQYTEYYALHTDAQGQEAGTGELVFREYYDLVNDPYQLTNLLYQATPAQEAALGIPALAAQLAADRAA